MSTSTISPDLIVRHTLTAGDQLPLNTFAQNFGRWIGEQRHQLNEKRKKIPRLEQDLDLVLSNHRSGGMAEVALAIAVNVCPMLQFEQYLDYNLRLPGGDFVGVQFEPKLRACVRDKKREDDHRARGNEPPDFHIVLGGEWHPHFFEFLGWATHAELLAAPLEELTYGPAYVLRTLHPVLKIWTPARGHGLDV